MIQLRIEIDGLDKELLQLDKVRELFTTGFYPEMQQVGDYLMQFFTRDVFETEGDIFNERWPELNSKYETWKATTYPGRGILERTGTLRYGFEAVATSNYLLMSNPVEYGIYHQKYENSREDPAPNIPQRVFMKVDQERADYIGELIGESVNKRIQEIL